AGTGPAVAQSRGVGAGSSALGDLLNALTGQQSLSRAPILRNSIQPNSALDVARANARSRGGQPSAEESPGARLAAGAVFSPYERILIQQYCTNDITEENERALQPLDEFSRLERDNCRRAGESVFQFGYEAFANLPPREII